jgi:hypothetical protein
MSARIKFLAVVAGLALLFFITHAQKSNHAAQADNPHNAETPLPAEAPTVVAPAKKVQTKPLRPKKHHPSTKLKGNDDGESNILPDLQHRLGRVVKLYASWPGATSRAELTKKLQGEEPFITEDAAKRIETEWKNTPPTIKLVPGKVVNISDLIALPNQSSTAVATVFLTLSKFFKPASGKPYSQTAVQSFTVSLQIIDRQWHVIGIAPQGGSSNASPSP